MLTTIYTFLIHSAGVGFRSPSWGRKEGKTRGNCVGLVRVAVVADEWRELKDRMAMGGR